MRRLQRKLTLQPAIVAALAVLSVIGCSSAPSDVTNVPPGTGVALNPGGQPKTAAQAAYAAQMQQMGNGINAQRARDAQAMAAAQAKAGAH